MSTQFYKEISLILNDFFSTTKIQKGERYYLQLDTPSEVIELVNALKGNENVKPFSYKHELGEEYTTFAIPYESIDLIIAYTSKNVKPDFLVTLRNLVGEQKGIWENTALLSIVSGQLDSIQGGSSDLQKEGMPLHPVSINTKLKKDIENSSLSKVDKIILMDNLLHLMEEHLIQQITFFEFEDIFSIIHKGKIGDEEYRKFGLFKDPDLATYKGKDQKQRLKYNREFFDSVRKIHELGLEQEDLEKRFSPEGAKELMKENWEEIPFSTIFKYHEDYLKSNKKKKVEFIELKIKNKLEFWDKPASESAAGKRKRHIIIFNPQLEEEEIELQFSFNISGNDKSLSSRFLRIHKSSVEHLKVEVKQTNIAVKIKNTLDAPIFAKFSYKHDGKASLGAEFLIAVLPIEPIFLDNYKSTYAIVPERKYIEIRYDDDELEFGYGIENRKVEIETENKIVTMSEGERLTIVPLPEAFNDHDELGLKVKYRRVVIPFLLRNELPETTPITGQRIWRLIRETGKDMQWIKENNRLILENREFYFHSEYKDFFFWEAEWIEQGLKSAKFESDKLQPIDLKLSDSLRETYSRFLTYFKTRSHNYNSIPSLSTMSLELRKRSMEYINEYRKEIESFKEGSPAGQKGRDLFKLGTIQSNGMIYFSPFHPLMVAFKLKVYDLLQNEDIDNSILSRLTADALVPFIYDEYEVLYKPDHQKAAMDWLVFKPVSKVSVSDANQYLAKVVKDKIRQFKEHFAYLFIENSRAPLQINIINISNDLEVIRGILQWMHDEIDKVGIEQLIPIEITLYNEGKYDSAFDLYARTDKAQQFEELFDVKLRAKNLEPDDVLRAIRSKLFFYKQDLRQELRYGHITFYKMHAQEHHAIQPINKMRTGLAIEGVFASVPSMKDEENYKSGFGTKCYSINNHTDYLVSTAYYINELAANLRNAGNDSYRKGEAIFSRTTTADEETLNRIFQSSHWVTFVDPPVDLEFFNTFDDNLVIIHYSDQYSSSSRYDAITVTDKSQQYYAVIKEFLKQKDVEGTDENVVNTIKAFNTFNGEWLLRIIGSKGHYDREKLSIISAIKFSASYFDHPNILWIPISLEEILRVAGAVSLAKSEGVFTAKNLGVKGNHSDDLLLIGLEELEGDLKVHFYPIEVKIGHNKADVIDKARKQVRKTKELFIDTLTGEEGRTFTGKFYRNFFAQLIIANAQKLLHSEFCREKNYDIQDNIIEKLLKDDYSVSNDLNPYIGQGAILSFQKDLFHRSAYLDNDVLILNLTERDGYEGLVIPIKRLRNWIQEKPNDFISEELLSRQYTPYEIGNYTEIKTGIENEEYRVVGENVSSNKDVDSNEVFDDIEFESMKDNAKPNSFEQFNNIEKEISKSESTEDINKDEIKPSKNVLSESNKEPIKIDKENHKVALQDVRILIGTAENSNRKIYWEYGNKDLANRHLLISGKSGQGKTYFMQCLIVEQSKLGIPTIVVDYTEGFLPNQLEPEFVEFLGNKLKQKIVYSEKLPINPFQKNVRDIGGIQLPESDTDVAERIKSVFSAVYKSLGIQQQNAIYEAVLKGLEKFGEQMNLSILKDQLEEDGSNYAKTALSQIRPLIDRNPFSTDKAINWEEVVTSDGEVYIIQLTGFPRDVQLIITEFILWDLWNYSIRFGNKNKPMPIILDEAQNLDHTEKSPSARILQEGRKFGWSAWYATQFLKAQLAADELARLQMSSQKVYFSPPEQELSNIASSLTKENSEKKVLEQKLAVLKKGQCIVHGPIRDSNDVLTQPTVVVVDISPLSERI